MTSVLALPSIPSLPSLLVKAAFSGKRRGDQLPDRSVRVEEVAVGQSHLGDYQRLCGWSVGDRLPHTYPHVLGFPLQAVLMSQPDFPLPMVGLVHVENTITVHRVLTSADRLTIEVRAEQLRPHPKGRQVDILTEVGADGELAWSGRSTYLARGSGDKEADRGTAAPGIPTGPAVATWSLPADLGRQYATVSGDANPIHLFGFTAKAMGFPAAIAHGMWTYARVLAHLGTVADGEATSHVWFKKPVVLPTRVDVVEGRERDRRVAGLRSTRRPEVEHLILEVS